MEETIDIEIDIKNNPNFWKVENKVKTELRQRKRARERIRW